MSRVSDPRGFSVGYLRSGTNALLLKKNLIFLNALFSKVFIFKVYTISVNKSIYE